VLAAKASTSNDPSRALIADVRSLRHMSRSKGPGFTPRNENPITTQNSQT